MRTSLWTISLLLPAALMLSTLSAPAPVAATAVTKSRSLASVLRRGQPVVLVVSPTRPDQATLQSESYGDWAAGLEAFQAKHPPGISVVTVSSVEYRRLIIVPRLPTGFGTLFVNGKGRALVHQGRLVDPFLYNCGSNYLLGAPTCKEVPSYGMPEITLRRR